jgi:uncharacterized protein (DUF1501 family)
MERRAFVIRTAKLLGAGLLLPSQYLREALALGQGRGSHAVRRAAAGDPILVAIHLAGGNDGLNTVVPLSNDRYLALRPSIAIPTHRALRLDADTGLHPALTPLMATFDRGNLAVVQGLGRPNPSLSHSRAAHAWISGSLSKETRTGWLARYLEAVHRDTDRPTTAPLAVQQGFSDAMPLRGEQGSAGVVVAEPSAFFSRAGSGAGSGVSAGPPTRSLAGPLAGDAPAFVRRVDLERFEHARAIQEAAEAGTNAVRYPSTDLGSQLRVVAKLVSGGLGAPVYLAAAKGFDTHHDQIKAHGRALANLAQSIAAFLADLDRQGLADNLILFTTSEFGRRVRENRRFGTDHGAAACQFVVGSKVNGGIYGAPPDLENLDRHGNLKMQCDYRSLYTTILEGHFGASGALSRQVLGGGFAPLGFLSGQSKAGRRIA